MLAENAWSARAVVGFINFVLWYGNTTILLMAAIMGVDPSLYEAAQIDGATSTDIFWKITMPLIRPILSFVLITSLIGGLQMYDVPSLITNDNGNPIVEGKPMLKTIVMIIQTNKDGDIGKAAALSILIFIFTAVVGLTMMLTSEDNDKKKKKKKVRG